MAATNLHLVHPIVKVVETLGEKPLLQNPHQALRRSKLQQNIHETRDQKKASTENPKKKATVRKTKNTKSVEEILEKTHPPRRPFTIPNCKDH